MLLTRAYLSAIFFHYKLNTFKKYYIEKSRPIMKTEISKIVFAAMVAFCAAVTITIQLDGRGMSTAAEAAPIVHSGYYELNISVIGEGVVTKSPAGQQHPAGPRCHPPGDTSYLYAKAKDGWSFRGWSGDVDPADAKSNTLRVYMDKNKSISAHFSDGVDVRAYYDTRETVIDENYGDNYGECSFITIVAEDENGLYDGTDPVRVKIRVGVPNLMMVEGLYGISDVTNTVSFKNPGEGGRNFLSTNWKGFYYALGKAGITSAKTAMESVSSAFGINRSSDVTVTLYKGRNPAVILVKDWVWNKNQVDLPLKAIKLSDEGDRELYVLNNFSVKTNVNNMYLIREKIGVAAYKKMPEPGTNYTECPGKFVIHGTLNSDTSEGKTYRDMMGILVDAESENGPWPDDGCGPDWIEVAAADIYNNATKDTDVTNCVWYVTARDIDAGGQVWSDLPFSVELNPYFLATRFNTDGGERNGSIHSIKYRDGAIYHEALHCYHMLPGRSVKDREIENARYCDMLYEYNNYLRFSEDSGDMGFLERNRSYPSSGHYIDGWLSGKDGDSELYRYSKQTHLYNRIIFTEEEIKEIFEDEKEVSLRFETDIPYGLPDGSAKIVGLDNGNICDIYLYKPGGTFTSSKEKHIWQKGESPWITIEKGEPTYYDGVNGSYKHSKYYFRIRGYNYHVRQPSIVDVAQDIAQGWKLYVVYGYEYKKPSYEYDASKFEITHKRE